LSKINTQFQKWQKELESYKKWALENDGIVSVEEQAEITRRQKDMDAILARVAQIVKSKGLLAFMSLGKAETKVATKEEEIVPTETTLERPDPLKAVAALNNEEAMAMLEGEDNIPKDDFIEACKLKLNVSTIENAIKAVKEPEAKVYFAVFNEKVARNYILKRLGFRVACKNERCTI